jgi:integrase
MTKLSHTRAAKLTETGRYRDGLGLYLHVKDENRSWLFRYERGGRERWMGLGRFADVSLEDARDAARAARNKLRAGLDPIVDARTERAENIKLSARAKLFREAADAFIDANKVKWSERHAASVRSVLAAHASKLGDKPVATIDKATVIDTLSPIWTAKYSTAKIVRGLVESVLDFAKVSGWRSGDNPATWSGNLQHVLPNLDHKAKNREALPFDEMYAFMTKLEAIESTAARAVEFAILTAVRSDEAREATWDEIDLLEKRWTIPAERMKTRKPHSVPLSPRALDLLKSLPREEGSNYVFIGDRAGAPVGSLLKIVKRIAPDVTMHGFRSSFRTWAGERTSFPHHVLEAALAHEIGSDVERAYSRGDLFTKRVQLMTAWATYVYTAPTKGATVTPMRRAG